MIVGLHWINLQVCFISFCTQDYLKKFGYLDILPTSGIESPMIDLQSAILQFQQFANLPLTGEWRHCKRFVDSEDSKELFIALGHEHVPRDQAPSYDLRCSNQTFPWRQDMMTSPWSAIGNDLKIWCSSGIAQRSTRAARFHRSQSAAA